MRSWFSNVRWCANVGLVSSLCSWCSQCLDMLGFGSIDKSSKYRLLMVGSGSLIIKSVKRILYCLVYRFEESLVSVLIQNGVIAIFIGSKCRRAVVCSYLLSW